VWLAGDGYIDYKEFVAGLARDKFVGADPSHALKSRRAVGDPVRALAAS
jgi:hypothetical protein